MTIAPRLFVIHYSPLFARLSRIIDDCGLIGLAPIVVNELTISKSSLKSIALDHLANSRPDLLLQLHEQVRKIFPILLKNMGCHYNLLEANSRRGIWLSLLKRASKSLSRSTIEHTCQHLFAIEALATDTTTDWAIIIEDDALLVAKTRFDQFVAITEKIGIEEAAFIDIGHGWGPLPLTSAGHTTLDEPGEIIPVNQGRTRCSYAYIVNKKCAHAINAYMKCQTVLPILPSDWHLSFLLKELSISTFWFSQPVFAQGSSTGAYPTNAEKRMSS